ncbi:LppX_LprAFG lipoprotein [Mycolicibacterium sp. P1-18]|uniref:LppX_LprAFG lipoprotein n=1 Tax=Mycolicibacterium sp. P1-18 TaxID=2024615 RepID=UPI0011F20D96|nr:LppX_LprAFG lipoprotein [Mycolicibacterium sp. P1-18]KAA0093663.1 LppX_LprAFG lipoprotein [Mycolicibacterium sp. P1-18]
MKFRLGVGLVAAVAAAALFTGCSSEPSSPGGSGATGGSDGGQDAAALVQQSADAMKGVKSLHFVLAAEGKVPNLKVSKVEADVTNTPTPQGTGTATVSIGGGNTTETKIVFVDGHLYSDVAEAGKFVDYGDGNSIYNISVLLDPQKGLANAISTLKDPKSAGSEDVNGVKTTKITGTSSTKDVAIIAGSRVAPEKERTVPVTVWIADGDPHYLVQAQIEPIPGTTVTLTLSEFGKPVTATKPV